jgi:hypothetical protein
MQEDLILKSIQSLFPKGAVWTGLWKDGDFKNQLAGISVEFARVKEAGDQIPYDFFPDTTELLDEWEEAFNLSDSSLLTEDERRARIQSRWEMFGKGSMQEANMEALFLASGFNVNVRVLDPGEDPRVYLVPSGIAVYNRLGARYNATDALWGNAFDSGINAFLLVNGGNTVMVPNFVSQYNKVQWNQTQYGEIGPPIRQGKSYTIPSNTDFWGMIYIIEGLDGNTAQIPATLQESFFALAYQLKPLNMWAVARVKFV